jgi:hypothetical protein
MFNDTKENVEATRVLQRVGDAVTRFQLLQS